MAYGCCLVPNARNIILETFTLFLTSIFLVGGIYFGSGNIYTILCHIGLILCCAFGISVLKCQSMFLGWVTVVFAFVVFVPYVTLMILYFMSLPAIINVMNTHLNINKYDPTTVYAAGRIVIISLIVMIIAYIAYIVFGISTIFAIGIRHIGLKNYKSRRQNDTSNSTVVHNTPPSPRGQKFESFPYYTVQSPQQQQLQPPPYSEKNRSGMALNVSQV